MSYERKAAHTVLLMVTPDWWTALEGIVQAKLKKFCFLFFHPHFISNLYNFFFHVWSRKLDVLRNDQSALFHTIKVNGECGCQALSKQ